MENVIIAAIFGLLGIILGVILNELLRRKNRIEMFSLPIFEKRLSIYEDLYKKVYESRMIAEDVISNPEYSQKQRLDTISDAILNIALFCDDHIFFIDGDLAAHCTAFLMGIEDIFSLNNEDQKQESILEYQNNHKLTLQMIEEESGVHQVKRLFKSINKPKFESPIIDRLNELRAEERKKRT